MPFQYVSVEEASKRNGIRMVVVGAVPSPARRCRSDVAFIEFVGNGKRGWRRRLDI